MLHLAADVGPLMVAGHPTWVCIPKQTNRHEKFRGLARAQFPLVLCYGMTVHKTQGLTLSSGCVFNMEHEPTWSPFKQMCGLAFVGFSRVTDFAMMVFKHVPDYWSFQSMVDTDLFRWRAELEQRFWMSYTIEPLRLCLKVGLPCKKTCNVIVLGLKA